MEKRRVQEEARIYRRDFPGDPVVKTLCLQCKEWGFNPCREIKYLVLLFWGQPHGLLAITITIFSYVCSKGISGGEVFGIKLSKAILGSIWGRQCEQPQRGVVRETENSLESSKKVPEWPMEMEDLQKTLETSEETLRFPLYEERVF